MLPELIFDPEPPEGGFRQLKVAGHGDIMLDRYIHGDVERISPEAPVPVLRHAPSLQRAGGAARRLNLAGPRLLRPFSWLLGQRLRCRPSIVIHPRSAPARHRRRISTSLPTNHDHISRPARRPHPAVARLDI